MQIVQNWHITTKSTWRTCLSMYWAEQQAERKAFHALLLFSLKSLLAHLSFCSCREPDYNTQPLLLEYHCTLFLTLCGIFKKRAEVPPSLFEECCFNAFIPNNPGKKNAYQCDGNSMKSYLLLYIQKMVTQILFLRHQQASVRLVRSVIHTSKADFCTVIWL